MSEGSLFGAWVKERRKALDLTQQDLAERAACAPVTITRIERGALRPSQQLTSMLANVLQIAPSERAEFMRLARGSMPGAGSDAASSVAHTVHVEPSPPTNLSTSLISLVGREQEIIDIKALLLPNAQSPALAARLLTLTGAPGIGKTSLALAVARQLLSVFDDGAFFVPLASISQLDGVLPAVMQVFGLSDTGTRDPLAQLVSYLRERHALLVLDNFEQVAGAGPYLLELLEQCAHLQLIVTSREALRIRGERRFTLQPLALPDPAQLNRRETYPGGSILATLRDYPAIALFEQRGQGANPAFRLTDNNASMVANICIALDGLPLAIDLVAARLNLLSPKELLNRLQSPSASNTRYPHETLRLASHGQRDLPTRHQTLRHAIGWSYDLLDEADQRLFRRLSVFSGGATLAAIEAVCDPMGDLGTDTLEGVSSLFAKNLLKRSTGEGESEGESESRLEMLETVREYALEQLERSGEEEQRVRRWHAEYYLALIESLHSYRVSDRAGVWYDSLIRERSNVRSALDWSLQTGAAEIAARMALELVDLWITGDFSEGRRTILRVLEHADALSPEMRAKVIFQGARIFIVVAELDEAERLLTSGLPLLDELGEEQRALFLMNLGGIALRRGEWASAMAHFENAVATFSEGDNEELLIRALNGLGEATRAELDYLRAKDYYTDALTRQARIGETYATAVITLNLSKVEIALGNYALARSQLRAVIACYRRLGTDVGIVACLNGVAEVLVLEELGSDAEAAAPAPDRDMLELAVVLFAAAHAEHEAIGYTPEPVDLEERERAKAILREGLGEERWQAAWDRGYGLSIEEACALPF